MEACLTGALRMLRAWSAMSHTGWRLRPSTQHPWPPQTREHAQLAKTLGVVKLIVVVNKLDDSSVVGEDGQWSQERYDDIVKGLTPFLKTAGYNPKKDLTFIPLSALHGHNVKVRPQGRRPRGKPRAWRLLQHVHATLS